LEPESPIFLHLGVRAKTAMGVDDFLRPLTRIQMELQGSSAAPFLSLVEAVTETSIVVDHPLADGEAIDLPLGETVSCSVVEEEGLLTFTAKVLDRGVRGNLRLLFLSRPAELTRVQRRQLPRLRSALVVRYRIHKDPLALESLPYYRTETRDISGGGLRFSSQELLDWGTALDLLIELPGTGREPLWIACQGSVVSVRRLPTRIEYGVKFVGIRKEDRERIVRYIWQAQAKSRLIPRG